MQKTAVQESQGIQGIWQNEARQSKGKCKVAGLGTSCDCHQHYVVLTDPVSTRVGTGGGEDWISVPSAGIKSCLLLWPRHGQLSIPDIHTREQCPVPVVLLDHSSVYIIVLFLLLAHLKQSLFFFFFFISANNTENFTFFVLYGSVSTL